MSRYSYSGNSQFCFKGRNAKEQTGEIRCGLPFAIQLYFLKSFVYLNVINLPLRPALLPALPAAPWRIFFDDEPAPRKTVVSELERRTPQETHH